MATARQRATVETDLDRFLSGAAQIVGREHVSVDADYRKLMSTDFSEVPLAVAEAIVAPGSTAAVAAVVELANACSVKLTARGGGMSYTLGYVPRDAGSVVLDMRRMNRVIEVNIEDKLVIVEPGVTWAELHRALAGTGYQVGCMGTMSGIAATIGGGLGNNATGHGRGDITDDLLGMEVVLPDGRTLLTGAFATNPDHPVLRSYGPDLTGLFTHDAGAFGIKTKAAFRLMRKPVGSAFLCYGFQDTSKLVAALCEVERLDVMSSNMAFSAYHHRVFAEQRASAAEAKQMLRDVMATASARLRGARELLALARPGGMRYLLKWQHSTFGIIHAYDQATADRMAAEAGRVMRAHGGTRLPAGLGVVMRAQPYMPIEKLMVGVEGECTFPSNCGVVLSAAQEMRARMEAFFDANAALMKRHGITWTRLFLTSKGGFGIEPIFYWQDRPNPLRLSKIDAARRQGFASRPENIEARRVAVELRRGLIDAVEPLGPYHFQIGKYYDFGAALRSPAAWEMLDGLKTVIDPAGIMNPGALGLR